jgi:hypothetical protein
VAKREYGWRYEYDGPDAEPPKVVLTCKGLHPNWTVDLADVHLEPKPAVENPRHRREDWKVPALVEKMVTLLNEHLADGVE